MSLLNLVITIGNIPAITTVSMVFRCRASLILSSTAASIGTGTHLSGCCIGFTEMSVVNLTFTLLIFRNGDNSWTRLTHNPNFSISMLFSGILSWDGNSTFINYEKYVIISGRSFGIGGLFPTVVPLRTVLVNSLHMYCATFQLTWLANCNLFRFLFSFRTRVDQKC